MNIHEEIKELKERLAELERIHVSGSDRVGTGNIYWYIDNSGDTCSCADDYDDVDDFLYKTGNYFKTEEEAEARLKIINTEIKLRALINRINKEIACPKDFPNRDNEHQNKWTICLGRKTLSVGLWVGTSACKWECCYRDFIDDAINEIGEEELVEYFKNR